MNRPALSSIKQVRLTDEAADELEEICYVQRKNVSEVMRAAINLYISTQFLKHRELYPTRFLNG